PGRVAGGRARLPPPRARAWLGAEPAPRLPQRQVLLEARRPGRELLAPGRARVPRRLPGAPALRRADAARPGGRPRPRRLPRGPVAPRVGARHARSRRGPRRRAGVLEAPRPAPRPARPLQAAPLRLPPAAEGPRPVRR